MKDETILYDPGTVRFCTLNGTAAFLWERLETPRSLPDLLSELSLAYRVDDRGKAERELQAVLAELTQLAFLESNVPPLPSGSIAMASDRRAENGDAAVRPPYTAPRLKVMDESEVLTEFQVTSAGITWWAV